LAESRGVESVPARILGVDPGSLATGWGLLGGSAGRPTLLDCGIIRLPPARRLEGRLSRLCRELEAVVSRTAPTCAAVEAPYHGVDPRAALKLAQARGVILAVLAGAGLEVAEYAPATVKKSVTGNGRASKQQVRWMVARLLGATAESTDVSDALAVALCHSASRRHHAFAERAAAAPRRARRGRIRTG
jgi:crossover junction endodeoxyribonuclease RuvC